MEVGMPILWKYDTDLGIAYFCPHCKLFLCCMESNSCIRCGGEINWKVKQQYKGKVKWN